MESKNKKVRYSFDTSQGRDADDVWHSTAIFQQNSENAESPGLGRIPSQTPTTNKRPPQNRPPSPVVITQSSGHFYFSFVLQKHGYIIGTPRNRTKIDAMVFRKNLTDWIQERSKGDSIAQAEPPKFIDDMKHYLSVKENLMHSMTPTLHAQEIFQPSLLHCLLGVMPLQRDVISIILPALTDIGYICTETEDVTYLNMILNQLKWLPELANGAELTDDILEILKRCKPKAQAEMIRYLPDIIPEKFHSKISDKLLKLLEELNPLCSSLMECFSVINITDNDLDNIRTSAVENMQLAEPKDYPAFFAFLFRSDNPVVLANVITDLREKFAFDIPGTSTDVVATTADIVDKIRFCISINDQIVPVWIKLLKSDIALESSSLFLSIDLVMLLIFIDTYSKVVEAPLKQLLGFEDLALQLVDDMIRSCPTVIDHIFTSFSKYLERILWSKESKSYSVATKILTKLFAAVSNYNAQQVVGTFTSVLAHGNVACRDHVIDALSHMARQNIVKLLQFIPLIMGIMDYIIKFSPAHVRDVMKILAAAAYIPFNRESQRFESEFSILMKKQLTHTNVQIKCVGVIGSVATFDQLVKQETEETKVQFLVDFIWQQVQRHEVACWIFFDEMANVVTSRNVPIMILTGLKAMLIPKFLENWTVPVSSIRDDETDSSNLKLVSVMNANNEIQEDALAIRFDAKPLGMSPLVIAAHTRLVCTLESQISKGLLDDVDIIIGCPLLLPSLSLYTSSTLLKCYTSKQKSEMGRYMLLAVNYFRETICAFCTQTDPEIRIKIWIRLRDLVKLQYILVTFASELPNVMSSLPLAYALDKTVRTSSFPGGERKRADPKEKGKRGKENKKKKSTKTKDTSVDTDTDIDDEVAGPSSKKQKPRKPRKGSAPSRAPVVDYKDFGDEIHPNTFVPHMRRFDTNVFLLLGARFVVKTPESNYDKLLVTVSSSQAPNRVLKEAEVLTPQVLVLLLRDLNHQIENSHICIIQNVQMGFPKDLFGCLCDLLETLFRAHTESMSTDLEKEVDSCFRYLYCTLGHYFEKIKRPEYKQLFGKALKVMVVKGAAMDQSELMDEEKIANYVGGFPDNFKNPFTAVEQLKFMKTLHDLVETELQGFISHKIEVNADIFLRRNWKLPSATVQFILKTWITTSHKNNTLHVLSTLASALISDDTQDPVPMTDVYKSCTALNFHTWYRVLMETLAQHVHKHTRKLDEGVDVLLSTWNDAFLILQTLLSVIKHNRKAPIITNLLKNTRIFLDAFITYGIKLLPRIWSRDTEQAKEFIKSLQVPARKIQYVCEHCKVEKSAQLMRHVPLVKRALETLVFRMREVVASHDASAFWMGSLKHRNLDGEFMDSEPFLGSQSEEEDEDDDSDDSVENHEDLFEQPGDEIDF